MKPLLLKIEGLNSFAQEQVIDFEILTSRGIFGIFGPTGSGKSTILDAMTLALYDEIARGTKEFINQDTGKTKLYFKFEIKNSTGREIYVVERSYKMQKSGTIAKSVRFYREDEPEILADKLRDVNEAIQNLIGMDYKDFTCSVVLPQGKFSRFLTLQGKERADMLEHIFHLESYGRELEEKIKKRKDRLTGQLQEKRGQLMPYEGVDQELLRQEEQQLDEGRQIQEQKEKELEKQNEQLKQQEQLWEQKKDLEQKEKRHQQLQAEKPQYDQKKRQLERAERAERILPLLRHYQEEKAQLQKIGQEKQKKADEYQEQTRLAAHYEEQYPEFSRESDRHLALIRKEKELEDARQLQREARELLDSWKQKEKELNQTREQLSQCERNIQEAETEKTRMEAELARQKQEIEQRNLPSSYKEAIRDGAAWEKEEKSQEKRLQELLSSQEKQETAKMQLSQQVLIQKREYQEQERQLAEQKKQEEVFQTQKMPDLLELGSQVTRAEEMFRLQKNREEEYAVCCRQSEELLQGQKELQKQLEQVSESYDQTQASLAETARKLEEWKKLNMAAFLAEALEEGSPCPVCGSTHHPQKASHIGDDLTSRLEQLQEKYQKKQEELEKSKAQIQGQVAVQKEKCQAQQRRKEELKEQLGDQTAEQMQQQFQQLSETLNRQKALETRIREQQQRLQQQKQETSQRIADISKKLAVAESRYQQLEEELRKNGKEIEERERAKEQCQKEQRQILSRLKAEQQGSSFDFCQQERRIFQLEREKETLERKKEEAEGLYQKNEQLLQQRKEARQTLSRKVAEWTLLAAEDQKQAKERQQKIEQIVGMRGLESYLADITAYRLALEKQAEAGQSYQEQQNAYKNQEKRCETQQAECEEQLVRYQFQNIQEAVDAAMQESYRQTLQEQVETYMQQMTHLQKEIRQLQASVGACAVTEQDVIDLRSQVKELQQEKEEQMRAQAILQEKIRSHKEKLETAAVLRKEYDQLETQQDQLESLAKILKGKKFVQYLAGRQLTYITAEASKRLGQITSERYGLTLEDENFKIVDNACGGAIREPVTLSGGEMFLTSFSLALALSSRIQMKNQAPLEFFFLDEGFGTLDRNLIDVVMSSLERLHEEHLHVGLISHVEELKERIPVRLTVTPATPKVHGSKTRIEFL